MKEEGIKIDRILEILPHRYPFLLVDRVEELEKGKRVKGFKNVSFNEPYFQGHFPGQPVMPGVLILEAMAQMAGILISETDPEGTRGKGMYLVSLDNVRFRRPVRPGDQLHLEISLLKRHGAFWRLECKAAVGEDVAAEAKMMTSLVEKP